MQIGELCNCYCLQARILLLAALLPICLQAACFDGEWVDAIWEPAACTLPTSEHAINQCLAKRNILWIGDSTNRQLLHNLARSWGVKMDHLPCNLEVGHGCFDCERGCHSLRYHEGRDEDKEWNDMTGTTPTGVQLLHCMSVHIRFTEVLVTTMESRALGAGNCHKTELKQVHTYLVW